MKLSKRLQSILADSPVNKGIVAEVRELESELAQVRAAVEHKGPVEYAPPYPPSREELRLQSALETEHDKRLDAEERLKVAHARQEELIALVDEGHKLADDLQAQLDVVRAELERQAKGDELRAARAEIEALRIELSRARKSGAGE